MHSDALFDAIGSMVGPDSFVYDEVRLLLGTDSVQAFYARPETIFDADSVYDRIIVYALTNRRLVLYYSDTNYEMTPRGEFVTTAQSVRLADIAEHHLVRRRVLEGDDAGTINSVLLRLRWGAAWQEELLPGQCDDPNCTNDHGFIGIATNEDFQMFLDRDKDAEHFQAGVDFMEQVVAYLITEVGS